MKKHILRAPQTDRYLLNVPTELGDLTDYANTKATGIGVASSAVTVEAVQTNNLSIATQSELVNFTGPTILTASVGGLFLCIVTILQTWNVVAAPNYKRGVGLSKNGAASFAASVLYDNDSTGAVTFDDQATFLLRLAAGDTIQPRFQNYMAGSVSVTASLSIVKVAP